MDMLQGWLTWARRSRLAPFIRVAKTVSQHLPDIEAALEHHLSNARVEAINTRICLITRIAYRFRSAAPAIAENTQRPSPAARATLADEKPPP